MKNLRPSNLINNLVMPKATSRRKESGVYSTWGWGGGGPLASVQQLAGA